MALTVRARADMHRPHLASLLVEARPPILRPRPLSEFAVGQVVRATMGKTPTRNCAARAHMRPAATRSCSRSSSASFAATGVPPSEIDPDAVGRVAPERVAAAVLLRVSHLHPQAMRWRARWPFLANRRGLPRARNWPESIPEPRTAWPRVSWT